MVSERRKSPRIPLDSLYFVTIDFTESQTTAIVIDISIGGMMLELSPTTTKPEVGEEGTISNASPELLQVLDPCLSVTVMWETESRCGVSFNPTQFKVSTSFNADLR